MCFLLNTPAAAGLPRRPCATLLLQYLLLGPALKEGHAMQMVELAAAYGALFDNKPSAMGSGSYLCSRPDGNGCEGHAGMPVARGTPGDHEYFCT